MLTSFDKFVVNQLEDALLSNELFATVEAKIGAVADSLVQTTGCIVFEHYIRGVILRDDKHTFFETFEQLDVALVW